MSTVPRQENNGRTFLFPLQFLFTGRLKSAAAGAVGCGPIITITGHDPGL